MSQVIKKAFVQANVICDGHGLARVTSRSFFLAKSQKEESRGAIVRILGVRVNYLFLYWACGPIQR